MVNPATTCCLNVSFNICRLKKREVNKQRYYSSS